MIKSQTDKELRLILKRQQVISLEPVTHSLDRKQTPKEVIELEDLFKRSKEYRNALSLQNLERMQRLNERK